MILRIKLEKIIGCIGMFAIIFAALSGCSYRKEYEDMSKVKYNSNLREEIVAFFTANYSCIEEIRLKIFESSVQYSSAFAKDDGKIRVRLQDGDFSLIWDEGISPVIKTFFSQAQELNFTYADFSSAKRDNIILFESYYPKNQTRVSYVYTEKDVSQNNMYERLSGNWYLYISYLT
jgi:hypothetical protein